MSRRVLCFALSGVVGLVAVQRAGAQEVMGGLTAWGAPVAPPAVPGGVPGGTASFWDTFEVVQLRAVGTAVATAAPAPEGAFRIGNAREQSFTLSEPAQVTLPIFLSGISVYSPTPGIRFAEWHGRLEVIDSTNAIVHTVSIEGAVGSTATFAVPDQFNYGEVALGLGAYRVRASIEIAGEAARSLGNAPGSSVTVDFSTGTSAGVAASVGAYPSGLGSSRAAVHAPQARGAAFGFVDGSGIEVGLLELGNPYLTHASMAGKITVTGGGVGGATADFRREHSLATAGLICADDVSDDNAGIAPGATIRSAPMASYATGFSGALAALLTANPAMKVINMSNNSGGGAADVATLESTINANPELTFVKSSGNGGAAGLGSVSTPGQAYNAIAVGAVDRAFSARRPTSSYGVAAGTPMKPDLVAPGEFINVPQSRDTDGNGVVDDFGRVFLGDDFRYTIAQAGSPQVANTNRVSGTSFAAPHVSGAAALLYDYQDEHANHSADHRVMKAVLLNSADTSVHRFGGAAWAQVNTGTLPGMSITQSLDPELGAGMLHVEHALRQYQPDEIFAGHANVAANFNIAAGMPSGYGWDFEQVPAAGRVNYLLGSIVDAALRATLTWDFDSGPSRLEPLEFRLYMESAAVGNPAGWDAADLLLAGTSGIGENVKLIDLLPLANFSGSGLYYLQVINTGVATTEFAVAVHVPEPAVGALGLACVVVARRRR